MQMPFRIHPRIVEEGLPPRAVRRPCGASIFLFDSPASLIRMPQVISISRFRSCLPARHSLRVNLSSKPNPDLSLHLIAKP